MDATDSRVRQVDAVPQVAVPPDPQVRSAALRQFVTRAPGPAPQGLLALAIYLAVFIIGFALPLISHLGVPELRQYWTDPNFYTWAMQWWPYAVSHGINPLYSTQVGAPGGFNLAWATTTPSLGLLMWPVTAAVGIVVSFNLTLLLIPPVSAWAAFVVARRLTGRFWASLLAGAVYGLTPFELVHDWQGQPNLTVIALFPLMVYLVLRWWDGTLGRIWFVIWMTVAMAAEFYTFNEAFADMTVVWAGGLVIGFVVAGRAAWPKVARLGLLAAIAYVGAIVVSAPYLIYALRHYPKELTRRTAGLLLHLIRLVLPVSDKLFGLTSLISYSNHLGRSDIDDYVGLPLPSRSPPRPSNRSAGCGHRISVRDRARPPAVLSATGNSSTCRGAGCRACRSRAAPSPPAHHLRLPRCSRSPSRCRWRRRQQQLLRWRAGVFGCWRSRSHRGPAHVLEAVMRSTGLSAAGDDASG